MATQVVKRDGSVQPFDEGKIKNSIRAAAVDAALAPERIEELVSQVSAAVVAAVQAKDQVSFQELRDASVAELEKVEPTAAVAWKKHETETKLLAA